MIKNAFDRYLESEVLSADSVKLITILLRAAGECVAAARSHLERGEIAERSRRITKAFEIVHELNRALDHNAGGEISRNLSELYRYMQARLIDANAQQIDAPLAEVEALLATLAEAWTGVAKAAIAPAIVGDPAMSEYAPICATY